MIIDYEQELTSAGGQAMDHAAGDAYGSKPYDMKATAPGDPAVGESLAAFMKITEAYSAGTGMTSITAAVVNDTDGAGTSEVVATSKSILLAALTINSLHFIGYVSPNLCSKRYLTAKVTTVGGNPGAGSVKMWVQKASDAFPINAGISA